MQDSHPQRGQHVPLVLRINGPATQKLIHHQIRPGTSQLKAKAVRRSARPAFTTAVVDRRMTAPGDNTDTTVTNVSIEAKELIARSKVTNVKNAASPHDHDQTRVGQEAEEVDQL
ncbi:hypothetical protein AAVH_09170 [Aphelenchoides avenae]|nr:hypothetical protein AAVH_09170 [Aphelenchus avenae]